jgi:hypothetical protein
MRTLTAVVVALLLFGSAASSQEKPQAPGTVEKAAPARPPADGLSPVPVKIQLVLSRLKGDKKIASLPYSVSVIANDRTFSNLRMGIEVPVGTGYRSVGTNIDCKADSVTADVFRVEIRVEDSSVLSGEIEQAPARSDTGPTPTRMNVPAFRTFKSSFTLLLRDGQTAQHTSAVDPISGEVMKVDVSLAVVK